MAEAGARPGKQLLASGQLQHVLACSALPLLNLSSLAALACSAPLLRDIAYLDDRNWATAAAAFLPPQHPSVTGLNRAAIQDILLRRAGACKAIAAGWSPATLTLQLNEAKGFSDMLISPGNDHLALITKQHVSLYDIEDGQMVWRRGVKLLQDECDVTPSWGSDPWRVGDPELFLAWHFGQNTLIACGYGTKDPSKGSDCLLTCTLDAKTGASVSNSNVEIDSFDSLCERSTMIEGSPVFAHNGKHVAVLISAGEKGEDSPCLYEYCETLLVVLDSTTCAPYLWTDLQPRHNAFYTPSPVWSFDDAKLASCLDIVDMRDGSAIDIYDNFFGCDGRAHGPMLFDRTGALIASTCEVKTWDEDCDDDDYDYESSALFIDADTGTTSFEVQSYKFSQFFTTRRHALLQHEQSQHEPLMKLSIWDLDQRAPVTEITLDGGVPHIIFDDQLLLLCQDRCSDRDKDLRFYSMNGVQTGLTLNNQSAWFSLSGDERILARITKFHDDHRDNCSTQITLAKMW